MSAIASSKRVATGLLLSTAFLCISVSAQTTTRVSLSSTGAQVQGSSSTDSISADGRFVTFCNVASNLVPSDTNALSDVFVRDIWQGTTSRVSVDSNGAQANGYSQYGVISEDGRFVVFESIASNLVPGDVLFTLDVFRHERQSGATLRVSLDSAGVPGNNHSSVASISADGRYVAFESLASNLSPGTPIGTRQIFVRDVVSGTTELISQDAGGIPGDGNSFSAVISSDARWVTFWSRSTNLVSGDTNGSADTFVRDRLAGTTERVSVSSTGVEGDRDSNRGGISSNGRFIAFHSSATNLVANDLNGFDDVFVRDRQAGTTQRVSVSSSGAEANWRSYGSSLSADGNHIVFCSIGSNLVASDLNGRMDVFVHNLQLGQTTRVSVSTLGAESNHESNRAVISANARSIAYESDAYNLVPLDTNGHTDSFVRDRWGPTVIYCSAKLNSVGCLPAIGFVGNSSASASSGFVVSATNVRNQKAGLLIYGISGRASTPFQGGVLCMHAPVKRGVGTNSGGTPLPVSNCTGVYSMDVNAFASGALGGNPALELNSLGTIVDSQWWGRDPGFPAPNNSTLSNALEFVVGP